MSKHMLQAAIKSLLEKEPFLTQSDISKKLKKDKAKVSGYLEAMADFGVVSVKKAGNSKLYFLNPKVKND